MHSIEWRYFRWPCMTHNSPFPSQVGTVSERLSRLSSFWAQRLPSAYPTLRWTGIRVPPERYFPLQLSPKLWTSKISQLHRHRYCQHTSTVSVVNRWRSRSPVYHTDRRHLCTTRWAWGTASRGSVSGSGDLCTIGATIVQRACDAPCHIRVTLKWVISVINKFRRRPTLLMTPRIHPPAHRHWSRRSWQRDTNFRR